jgi:hypothetical protein
MTIPGDAFRGVREILLITIGVMMTACQPTAKEHEIVGSYRLNKGNASDSLELKSDGTFSRTYMSEFRRVERDTGRWQLTTERGQQRLVLTNFTPRWLQSPKIPEQNGYWSTYIKTSRGTVRIVVNADLGWRYEQVRSH